jgi:hypothetical protein
MAAWPAQATSRRKWDCRAARPGARSKLQGVGQGGPKHASSDVWINGLMGGAMAGPDAMDAKRATRGWPERQSPAALLPRDQNQSHQKLWRMPTS